MNAGSRSERIAARLLFYGELVTYIPLEDTPYYAECVALVKALQCELIELTITQHRRGTHVQAVISGADGRAFGSGDCAKIHRTLQARLEVLTGCRGAAMTVTSPGIERNIKNAAEFALFPGRLIRMWDKNVSDWVTGKIISADKEALTFSATAESGKPQRVPYSCIAKAKLVFV
ncbi:ribosome maturation factor [Treponema endosymbiont of Eucomonympha sp.]|uniref:ribosome maturation factor n=1 Tax=Treponema endosymbiont of Eucomonympha sp. TaxID=1580831 RepID=UPI001650C829|nr:ribosome maturation factor [Treponema endosymbiont of Eucomonympha sp.]